MYHWWEYKCTVIIENSLVVSQNLNIHLPSTYTPRHLPKKNENLCSPCPPKKRNDLLLHLQSTAFKNNLDLYSERHRILYEKGIIRKEVNTKNLFYEIVVKSVSSSLIVIALLI